MSLRIGVDVGGTFTDAIVFDDVTGKLRVAKNRSTPTRPEVGVLDVVDQVLDPPGLAAADFFLHATTAGLNALLQRAGGVVGLLTTGGFRDVLELRRGTRDDLYGLLWGAPEPLVPRRRRLGVPERVLVDGSVDQDLDEQAVRRALEVLRAESVDSIAVVYINSHANPAHELRTEEILREAGLPAGYRCRTWLPGSTGSTSAPRPRLWTPLCVPFWRIISTCWRTDCVRAVSRVAAWSPGRVQAR